MFEISTSFSMIEGVPVQQACSRKSAGYDDDSSLDNSLHDSILTALLCNGSIGINNIYTYILKIEKVYERDEISVL